MHKFIHFRNPKENTSSAAAEHVEVKLEPNENENDDVEMLEDYGEIKVYVVHVFYSVSFYIGRCLRSHSITYILLCYLYYGALSLIEDVCITKPEVLNVERKTLCTSFLSFHY